MDSKEQVTGDSDTCAAVPDRNATHEDVMVRAVAQEKQDAFQKLRDITDRVAHTVAKCAWSAGYLAGARDIQANAPWRTANPFTEMDED